MARKTQPTEIYQLKITLKYSKPPIWRRWLGTSHVTLEELHHTLQMDYVNEGPRSLG